MMAALE